MPESPTDCLACRLISGGGLAISGLYLYFQGLKQTVFNRYALNALGSGLGIVGLLRLFDLLPFKHSQRKEEVEIITDQDDYNGKLPSKFR